MINAARIKLSRALIVAGAVACITACAGQPRTTVGFQLGDVRTFAKWSLSKGPMWVDIRGQPFDAPRADLEATVTSAVADAIAWTADPRITADAEEAGQAGMRIVMTFNSGIDAQSNCAAASTRAGGGPQESADVSVAATFCDGGSVLSHVNGAVVAPASLSDQHFTALIRQVTRDLLPTPVQPGRGGVRIGT